MAKKKRVPPVVHPPTKRQLSHWQQQKRRQRIIFTAGMAVIAAVLIIIGSGVYFGWYVPEYRPLHETVVEVNGDKFSLGYLIDFVTDQYGQYATMALDYGITNIEDYALIRQEAEKLGYSVTEKEIDDALKGLQVPETAALRDAVKTQLLAGKLRDEYFKPQLPANPPQRQVMALFMESLTKANEVKTAILNGTDFGLMASEMSLDETTKTDKGDLGWHPREVLPVLLASETVTDAIFNLPVDSVELIKDADKTKQLGYWIVKVTERKDDGQSHVFGILVGSEDEAVNIKSRLDTGEDFDALAKEFSQNYSEENGADMGWIPADSTDATAEFIFNTTIPLNTISPPIKDTNSTTKGGYWVIKVAAAEDRALSAEDQDTVIGQMFDKWLTEARENPDTSINSYFDDNRREWALSYLQNKA